MSLFSHHSLMTVAAVAANHVITMSLTAIARAAPLMAAAATVATLMLQKNHSLQVTAFTDATSAKCSCICL